MEYPIQRSMGCWWLPWWRKGRLRWCRSLDVFNENQRMMLNRLFDGFVGNLTSSKWAKICKVSQDTASREINALVANRILRKEGNGRSTHYVLSHWYINKGQGTLWVNLVNPGKNDLLRCKDQVTFGARVRWHSAKYVLTFPLTRTGGILAYAVPSIRAYA